MTVILAETEFIQTICPRKFDRQFDFVFLNTRRPITVYLEKRKELFSK